MLRLAPPGFERFLQSPQFVATFGGGEESKTVRQDHRVEPIRDIQITGPTIRKNDTEAAALALRLVSCAGAWESSVAAWR